MASASIDTGHGATAVFSITAITSSFTSIDVGNKAKGKIETTHLGTTGNKTFMPEDLDDPGEVTIPYHFDAEAAEPATGSVETLTVTLPLAPGQTTAATLAGTGFITNVKRPNLQTNTIQDGSITFAFDGLTGPTFTPAVTS